MKKKQKAFITNDSGKFWSWSMRIWIDEKRPVMAEEVEIQMASRSDPTARIFYEECDEL